jgi:glycosyltransferase involved in cell wall biosynthesis
MRAPVSVIIPCYRCTKTIERAVASIARQTLPPEEVLLVEDCSDDEGKTLDLLYRLPQKYQDRIELKIISLEKNGGPAVARNAGWEAATQPYIAFLDADDEWHPEKLNVQYEYMRRNPKIAVTGHQHILSLNSNPTQGAVSTASYKDIAPLSLLFKNCFPTSSVMLRKIEIPFRFTAEKRYCEDIYLWQQLAFAGFPIVRIEAPLLHYYKALYGEGGLSAQLWKMEKGELDNLLALYRAGSINLLLFLAATGFSITKHVKRLLVTWINRVTRRVSGRVTR